MSLWDSNPSTNRLNKWHQIINKLRSTTDMCPCNIWILHHTESITLPINHVHIVWKIHSYFPFKKFYFFQIYTFLKESHWPIYIFLNLLCIAHYLFKKILFMKMFKSNFSSQYPSNLMCMQMFWGDSKESPYVVLLNIFKNLKAVILLLSHRESRIEYCQKYSGVKLGTGFVSESYFLLYEISIK